MILKEGQTNGTTRNIYNRDTILKKYLPPSFSQKFIEFMMRWQLEHQYQEKIILMQTD